MSCIFSSIVNGMTGGAGLNDPRTRLLTFWNEGGAGKLNAMW